MKTSNNLELSKELLFIKAALLSDSDRDAIFLTDTIHQITDWKKVLKICRTNNLAPLCFYKLNKNKLLQTIPDFVAANLKQAYQQSALESLKKQAVYREVGQLFNSMNIKYITLKGMAIENSLYPQAGLRPMIDIDLLIPEENLEKARKILLDNNAIEIPIYETKYIASFSHQIEPLVYKGVNFELHRNIVDRFDSWDLPLQKLWESTCETKIHNNETQVFTNEFMLVHLCNHAYNTIKGGRIKLISYYDIFKLIENEDINWGIFHKIVSDFQIQKSIFHSLSFTVQFFELSGIPESIISESEIYLNNPQLVRDIIEVGEINTIKDHYFEKIGRIPSISGKIKYLLSKAFPNRKFMIHQYDIKKQVQLFCVYSKHIGIFLIKVIAISISLFNSKNKATKVIS